MKKFVCISLFLGFLVSTTGCESHAEKSIKSTCRAVGNDSSFCSCVYDKLEDHYTSSDLEKMYEGKKAMPEDMSSVDSRAMLECHSEN
jgi:hypothetical protein